MRKKPDIKPRKCERCGEIYKPNSTRQKHCPDCKVVVSKETKLRWYRKNFPDAKPKVKSNETCCICGKPFACHFDGQPYCNLHYLRMYNNGTPWLRGRKTGNPYTIDGEIVTMSTSDRRTFTIDKSDLNKVLTHTWCYSKTGYLVATVDGKVRKLSRFLLNPPDDKLVDHINGNPADYRRCNLRICTPKENARNCGKAKNAKCKYVGVWRTKNNTYRARIMVDRKEIGLGTYKTEEEARQARLKAEKKYFGEYARSYAEEMGI